MRRDFARFSEEPGCLTYCAIAVWRRRVCGSGASNGTCSSRSIKRSIRFGNGSHHDARLQRSVSSLVVAPPASGYRPEIVTSARTQVNSFPTTRGCRISGFSFIQSLPPVRQPQAPDKGFAMSSPVLPLIRQPLLKTLKPEARPWPGFLRAPVGMAGIPAGRLP